MDKHERRVLDLTIETGSCELNLAIRNWLKWDRNKKTSCEIMQLLEAKDYDTLRARLYNRISFGTAGLRGRMRAGFDSMNDLVIIQTAQGILKVIENMFPRHEFSRGVVLGYDGRYNSKRFAQLSALTFVRNGVSVLLFSRMVATPFVPFTIKQRNCLLGIMVTASHNPKEDNGYKVYWENGTQIIPPLDQKIQQAILEHLEPEPKSFNTGALKDHPLLSDPFEEMFQKYYEILKVSIPQNYRKINSESNLQVVYTAMHGVGYPFIQEAFRIGKFRAPVPVVEQVEADPEFPTVAFPNPEEGKSALEMALAKADAEDIKLVLANDPDADRMVFAEKDLEYGVWKIFNGNEIGALFGWWTLHIYQLLEPSPDLANVYMIASAVSSKILRSMANIEGFNFEETLTGFKWMGNRAIELTKANKRVLFAFEEAIGFMIGMTVIDKDGISAAYHLATMACYLRANEDKTLKQKLTEIWERYGYHVSKNGYMICDDPELSKKIFDRLRMFHLNHMRSYPKEILNGEFQIASVRDMNNLYDNSEEDKRAKLPNAAGGQMITFRFTNGMEITFRTSGTEPKMKYYSEMMARPEEKDWDAVEKRLSRMVDGCVEEFFEPEKNNLVYKKCIEGPITDEFGLPIDSKPAPPPAHETQEGQEGQEAPAAAPEAAQEPAPEAPA